MRIDPRSRNAGRFARKVQKELQKAVVHSGLRQQQIAQMLDVDRSIINRRLTGEANLTLRSIADLAWATNHKIVFALEPRDVAVVGANEHQRPESGMNITLRGNTLIQQPNAPRSSSRNTIVVRQHEGA